MSATSPNLEERKNLSDLIQNWLNKEFAGSLSKAERASKIPRPTIVEYLDADSVGWPREGTKTKLAKAMGMTLSELNAAIEGIDLERDVSFDRLIEQIRLCDDAELIHIDRTIADVRESRLP
jgi:hypothetical protein